MSMAGTVEAITATFGAYAQAFQTLEPDAAAPLLPRPVHVHFAPGRAGHGKRLRGAGAPR
jgi:hypothetical protein